MAINSLLAITGKKGRAKKCCDIDAGIAHLTLMLAAHGIDITAVEPNKAMRDNGIKRTNTLTNVTWSEGTGEARGQPRNIFDLVTFGSSFNVCDRDLALKETSRILKPGGWFACLWNHRSLENEIQLTIESIIRTTIPNYDYGSQREDQQSIIDKSNLFETVLKLSSIIKHTLTIEGVVEAWCSHATLQRQAGGAIFYNHRRNW